MPRPQKKRYVCCMPQNKEFAPMHTSCEAPVTLTVDEYETIRLIDLEGVTQEECAVQLHVSRTTIQGIYNSARKKIADALVHGKRFMISGGDYIVCQHYAAQCGRGCHRHCHKHQCSMNHTEDQ